MLPIWYYLVFAVVFAVLLYSVWRVWSPEIRARLIPEAEILKIAEELIAKHGVQGAKTVVFNLCQNAMHRHELYETAKWDRVARWLHKHSEAS